MSDQIGKKALRALERIQTATDSLASMYPGEPNKFVSWKIASGLRKRGYIQTFIPHNPVHHERWVITERGRAALEKQL